MQKNINKFVYWTPRVLSILFILFLAMFSLDIFSMDLDILGIIVGLFMHNIPTLILLIIVIISWKYEIVGGIGFIAAGILYLVLTSKEILTSGFEFYYLSWIALISGPAFLTGILYLVCWNKKKRESAK